METSKVFALLSGLVASTSMSSMGGAGSIPARGPCFSASTLHHDVKWGSVYAANNPAANIKTMDVDKQ